LTSSLYIPGRLVKDAEILVDVGAGFFVGRSAVDAKEILNRKVAYLKANTDSLMKVITVRQNNLNALREEIDERKAQQGIVQGSAGVQKLQS
jgi:prefoldin alpha subunit